MTRLDDLRRLAEMGWRLMPSIEKAGIWPWQMATSDQAFIRRWTPVWRNWAVLCGPASGIVAIDVDGREGAIHLGHLEYRHGILPDGPIVISGSGTGEHRYFRWPEGRKLRNGELAPHLELRGNTLLLTLPGSIHPETGREYLWEQGREPWSIDLPELPGWICDEMAPRQMPSRSPVEPPRAWGAYLRSVIARETAALASAKPGGRNRHLFDAGRSLMRFAADGRAAAQDIAVQLADAAAACGLDEREAWGTIRSAARARGVEI